MDQTPGSRTSQQIERTKANPNMTAVNEAIKVLFSALGVRKRGETGQLGTLFLYFNVIIILSILLTYGA